MPAKGVTLTEALVILAILAILFVIFFPVFARPHRGHGARQNTCTNNQRQISIAIVMYAQDNTEVFFPDPGSTAWTRYIKADDACFDCPTLTGKGKAANPEYGFNANLFSKKLDDIPQPTATLLTADLKPGGMFTNYALTSANPSDAHYFEDDMDPRHNNGFVCICVDGSSIYAPVKHGDTIGQTLKDRGIYLNPASAPEL